ncbi:MAG TPA: hypothetical protein VHT30_03740 [Acidimicrobiales bacterium]|jgi:hypothetical protein|nr:hypothetical protein [Acidimicrobiales bacterium]
MSVMPKRWRKSWAALALLPLTAWGLAGCHSSAAPSGPPCTASSTTGSFALDTDQAANAATIAAVATRLGLPPHAATIALATALQESKLINLPFGDQDSLGLFQQRPSQGWGAPTEIMIPREAAAAFYQHLEQVPDWQNLPVTVAAQDVQHSADGSAYAQWEAGARQLAQALTGEVPAAFTCRIASKPSDPTPMATVTSDLTADLGAASLGVPVASALGWQVAGWLVGHAATDGFTSITFGGMRWSSRTGKWTPTQPVSNMVEVAQ